MNNLSFLQTTFTPDEIAAKISELEPKKTDFSRIRCPHCKWQPGKSDRWMCTDAGFPEYFLRGCYTAWNTFETGGRCPGCKYQWLFTSCLSCGEFSAHEDWYEKKQNSSDK